MQLRLGRLAAAALAPLQQQQLPAAALRALSSSCAATAAAAAEASAAMPAREQMRYDVCIVGAGPAGLSAAIRFKQLCAEAGKELSVAVIDKGGDVGAWQGLQGCSSSSSSGSSCSSRSRAPAGSSRCPGRSSQPARAGCRQARTS